MYTFEDAKKAKFICRELESKMTVKYASLFKGDDESSEAYEVIREFSEGNYENLVLFVALFQNDVFSFKFQMQEEFIYLYLKNNREEEGIELEQNDWNWRCVFNIIYMLGASYECYKKLTRIIESS